MVHEIRLADSGNFPVDPRAYRQGINLYAAQQLMEMVNNNQLPDDSQLPPALPTPAETPAAAHVVDLFSRNRLEN